MNKRDFVMGATAWAVAALVENCASAAVTSVPTLGRLPDLAAASDLKSWRRYVGEHFEVRDAQVTRMLLERIAEAKVDQGNEQFTIVFRAESGESAPTGLHSLRHANGQRVALFLDPAASGAACVAHFNRLK